MPPPDAPTLRRTRVALLRTQSVRAHGGLRAASPARATHLDAALTALDARPGGCRCRPLARTSPPALQLAHVASPISLCTHGGTRVSNRSMQEAAVELGDGQWHDQPSCWAHTRHAHVPVPVRPRTHDEKEKEISQRFRDGGLQGGIKRRSHPPKTPSLLLPRQQRR